MNKHHNDVDAMSGGSGTDGPWDAARAAFQTNRVACAVVANKSTQKHWNRSPSFTETDVAKETSMNFHQQQKVQVGKQQGSGHHLLSCVNASHTANRGALPGAFISTSAPQLGRRNVHLGVHRSGLHVWSIHFFRTSQIPKTKLCFCFDWI